MLGVSVRVCGNGELVVKGPGRVYMSLIGWSLGIVRPMDCLVPSSFRELNMLLKYIFHFKDV